MQDILLVWKNIMFQLLKTHISDLVAFTRSVIMNGVTNDRNAKFQLDQLTKGFVFLL